jgi:hypothetical protein
MWRRIIFALCTKWLRNNETAVDINNLSCIITSFPLSSFHITGNCIQQNKEKKLTPVVLATRFLVGLDMSLYNYSHYIKTMYCPVRYTIENHEFLRNSSNIYKNLFHCHKNSQHSTRGFGSKLLPSSGE